ncbi:hypothetical protein DFQ27_002024 [Actinomortierella ambigua]|uniref:Protein kinase domain-containing protein n=1 Tax=Actinomortierella ambigua TaxID=1343610 RepID=A0A9P6QC04_9FUNG|nr:hypothetical protein DFQ27_002024 [Actinomortierella ambigua]
MFSASAPISVLFAASWVLLTPYLKMSRHTVLGVVIGVGGYGNVYHAHWEGREVAIKRLYVAHAETINDESIQREVQLLESLRDKHIIQFYGTTSHEDRLVIVMEYAEGGCLQRAIQQRRLDWPNKTRIAEEIARGLAYIHHKGVLHRDLKSMNVLLSRQMEAKLCDFGLATIKVRSASMSTALRGTFRWMAPELFGARPKYSTKSDMYALGMVMWEMAANCTVPFQEQLDNMAVIALVVQGHREELPETTPSEYRRWVERCWDQNPDKRPEASEIIPKAAVHPETVDGTRADVSTMSLSIDISQMFPLSSSSESTAAAAAAAAAEQTSVIVDISPEQISACMAKAKGGDAEAQLALAALYERGAAGMDRDDSEAFKWYLRAATQGSLEAQHKTGDFLRRGRSGIEKDLGAALSWIRKAAERGHAVAQKDLGRMYYAGQGVERDYVEAASWYRQSAEQGNASAQSSLGAMYRSGLGVERDYDQALSWYQKSAEQGNAAARCSLGVMYRNGHGVERDCTAALSWFRKSAEQGNAVAQCSLGVMYVDGYGVERDYIEAVLWYRKSAEQGNTMAQLSLGSMYLEGRGVGRDYVEALLWFRQAAEQGNATAQNSLGKMYASGYGVRPDYTLAMSWYRKSAEQGDAKAQNNLGRMYENGHGVRQDDAEAVSWYQKSTDQGYAKALNNLGKMYENGRGVEQDYGEAMSRYRRSAEQGNADAQYNVGAMYEQGQGVHKDVQQATLWYRKAADLLHVGAIERLETLEQITRVVIS